MLYNHKLYDKIKRNGSVGMKKVLIIIAIMLVFLCSAGAILYFNVTPTIKLKGDEKISINISDEYEDEGASLVILGQDFSNKLTLDNKVDTTKTGEYKVTYSFKSKFLKKSAEYVRMVSVVDEDAPTIILEGAEVTIDQGSKYQEPGYTASDGYDGDLTASVEVTNDIDTKKSGEYTVTYSVSDSSGNIYHTNRKVIVKKTTTTTKKTTTKDPNKDGDNSKVTTKKGSGDGLPILMYHYFYDEDKGETGENSNWMEMKDFEAQIKYLVDNKYYFPTWQEVRDFVDGKITLPAKSIVISIDDGHSTLFTHAIPLLEKYNVKATAFIITSRSAAKKFKKYQSENIVFQSHTHDMHQGGCSGGHGGLFRCINYDKGLADLKQSISVLGSSDAIAYPYGDVTKNVLNITTAANFKVGVTTKFGQAKKGMNPLQLPRIRMSKGVSLKGFINNIS